MNQKTKDNTTLIIKTAPLVATMLLLINLSIFSQIKVACIGDSITAGYGLSDPSTQGYPAQLNAMLGSGYTINNYGISGTTLLKNGDNPYWNQWSYTDSTNWLPDIVIIMLGTNDSKDYNWIHKEDFIPDYTEMINHYADLSSHPIVYVATCATVYGPGGSGQWGITDAVVTGEIVPLQKQIASQTNCPLIDINSATKNMSGYFPDYIHPNTAGCTAIARQVYDVLSGISPTSPPAFLNGDANMDTEITIVDALLVAQYYVGLNPSGFYSSLADTNCDDSITIVDALLITQYYVGLIHSLNC